MLEDEDSVVVDSAEEVVEDSELVLLLLLVLLMVVSVELVEVDEALELVIDTVALDEVDAGTPPATSNCGE